MKSVAYRKTQRFLKRYGVEEYGQPGGPSMEADFIRIAGDESGKHDNLRFAIHRFVSEAIFTPNPNDIPLWGQTPWGALVMQLKSFPLMMERMVRDIISEIGHGNPWPAIYLVTAGAGAGAIANGIKDLIQRRDGDGENTRTRLITKYVGEDDFGIGPMKNSDIDKVLGWWFEGLIAAGGLGLIVEMMYNAAAKAEDGAWGKNRIMSMVSPTIGTGLAAITVATGAFDALKDNDKDYPERAAVRELVARIPVAGGVRTAREFAADLVGDAAPSGGTRQSAKFSKGFSGGF